MLMIALISSTSLSSQWKIDKISIGFEYGIKKDFTSFTQNDGGYFLLPQHDWLGRRFLLGDSYFGGNINIYFKNKFLIDFGIYSHIVAEYDIYYIPEIENGNSGSSASPFLKYVLGFGRDIKLKGRFYYQPSLLLSFIPTDNGVDGDWYGTVIGPTIGGYYYHNELYSYTKNNFTLGLRNTLQWKFNARLNLNFGFSYNHGLQKFSKADQTLTLTTMPETVYKGESISRLSHSTLFLSAQYSIWQATKKPK